MCVYLRFKFAERLFVSVCAQNLWLRCVWNEPKHVTEFLILITNMCCIYWLNKLLYYGKTQRDGCY